MNKCTRNFYEESVYIRGMKLIAAENGYDALMDKITASTDNKERESGCHRRRPGRNGCGIFPETLRHGDYIV